METEEKGSENQRISLETPERKSTEQKEQREGSFQVSNVCQIHKTEREKFQDLIDLTSTQYNE